MLLTRRKLLLAGAATSAAIFTRRTFAQARDKVRFGVLHPNLTAVIHAIALQTGAYDGQNIEIEEHRFKSGQTVEGLEQLWRGNLDFWMAGAPEVVRLNSRVMETGGKPPLVVVSGTNPGHTCLVLSNKIPKPASVDALLQQPLKIAVSSPSSVHLAFFRGFLRTEKKLDVDKIAWQFLPIEAGNMLPAMSTGQIDGLLHSEPTPTLAITNNIGYLYLHGARGDMGPNPPPGTFLTGRREFIEQNPEVARRFMQALFDANKAYKDSPKEKMIPIMSEWSGQDAKIIDVAYERMNPTVGMNDAQAKKWWDFNAQIMIERGEILATMDPARDVFDLSLQPTA